VGTGSSGEVAELSLEVGPSDEDEMAGSSREDSSSP